MLKSPRLPNLVEVDLNLQPVLERLLSVEEPRSTVVTLTLDVSESGILPEATRVFLKERMRGISTGPSGLDGPLQLFETIAGRIMRYVESDLNPKANGLFLTVGPSTWEPVELAVPLCNFLYVGRTPFLAPLLEAAASAPKAYVVQGDERGVLLEEVALGVWKEIEHLSSETAQKDVERIISGRAALSRTGPRTGGTGIGGGGRDRFEQWTKEAGASTVARAARRIGALDADASAAMYFFGRKEMYEVFKDHLPSKLQSKLTHLGPVPRRQKAQIRKKVEHAVTAAVRDRVEGELLEFHERRAKGKFVALGPLEVIDQMTTGKIARVFLDAENPIQGMKCLSCGTRSRNNGRWCKGCGGAAAPVSLAQEVIAQAIRHPPLPISFVPRPAGWLAALGGMAALLSQKGMRSSR